MSRTANEEIKRLCYHIIDLINYVDNVSKLHDCNDCKAKNDCPQAPKIGEFTRINCFAWVGEQQEEK